MEVPADQGQGQSGSLGTMLEMQRLLQLGGFKSAQHLTPTLEGKRRDSQLMREVRAQTRGKIKQKKKPRCEL